MVSNYRYLLVHLYFTLPPAAVLHFLFLPVRNRRDIFKIALLTVIAVVSTTPWDSYLVRNNVWTYPPFSVLGTLFSIPFEEFLFFLIQTYITSTLYLILAKPIFHPFFLYKESGQRIHSFGVYFFAVVTAVGAWMVQRGHEQLYLGLILVWAGPILTLLTYVRFIMVLWVPSIFRALSGSYIAALPLRVTCGSIIVPTVYLWYVDSLALRDGIWAITKGTKLDWQLWGDLDIEEAVFFLVTNTLIIFGLIACDMILAVMDAFPEIFPPFRYIPSFRASLRALSLHPSQYNPQRLRDLRDVFCILEAKSRSFCLASIVFPDRCRTCLLSLYAFCRTVDDFVDEAPGLEVALEALRVTRNFLDLTYSNPEYIHDLKDIPPHARAAFALLPTLSPFIPVIPFLDLLAGLESDLVFLKPITDITGLPIQTGEDLITYCERVASTVAHMFVHTTWHCEPGVSRSNTTTGEERVWILARAKQMGIALQLVNIARDIIEDAQNGRAYIPVSWFKDAGELVLLEALLRDPHDRKLDTSLSTYALRLVHMAHEYYAAARPGLEHVPQECRKGAQLAIEVYMEIGREIERRHGNVRTRVVVSRWTKLRTAFKVLYGQA